MNYDLIFLRAKHWQLFSVIHLIPAATLFGLVWWLKETYLPSLVCSSEIEIPTLVYLALPTLVVLPLLSFLGWLWSVGTGLQAYVKDSEARMNTAFFKVFFITPFLILGALAGLVWWYWQEINVFALQEEWIVIALGLATTLFLQFCALAVPYGAAKSLRVAEENRPVSFWEPIGDFFLILFFPVGIWFLQPRINRVVG